jgi:hypothetical protein
MESNELRKKLPVKIYAISKWILLAILAGAVITTHPFLIFWDWGSSYLVFQYPIIETCTIIFMLLFFLFHCFIDLIQWIMGYHTNIACESDGENTSHLWGIATAIWWGLLICIFVAANSSPETFSLFSIFLIYYIFYLPFSAYWKYQWTQRQSYFIQSYRPEESVFTGRGFIVWYIAMWLAIIVLVILKSSQFFQIFFPISLIISAYIMYRMLKQHTMVISIYNNKEDLLATED